MTDKTGPEILIESLRRELAKVTGQLADANMIKGLQKSEIEECNLEIDRHHRDFERIREVLTKHEEIAQGLHQPMTFMTVPLEDVETFMRELRNIVG